MINQHYQDLSDNYLLKMHDQLKLERKKTKDLNYVSRLRNDYQLIKQMMVRIRRIITIQIARLVKNCFNLELDCRKAGSTNKSIPSI